MQKFKEGQKVLYRQTSILKGGPIPDGTIGIIKKAIEDEMLVDFGDYGLSIVVPSCVKIID